MIEKKYLQVVENNKIKTYIVYGKNIYGGSKESKKLIKFFSENEPNYTTYKDKNILHNDLMDPDKKWTILYWDDDEVLEFRCGKNKAEFDGIDYNDIFYYDIYGIKNLFEINK